MPPIPEILPVEVTIRDFTPVHADFEMDGDKHGGIGIIKGIVQPNLVNRKPAYAGNPTTRWTSGKDNFDLWYTRNDASSTKKMKLFLRKVPGTEKTYQFDSQVDYKVANSNLFVAPGLQPGEIDFKARGGFFPIDGELLGNFPGTAHNFHFTLEMNCKFTYKGDETFKFRGDDDLWVFINGKLAIDLGGVHKAEPGTIDLSNPQKAKQDYGIEVGKDYTFDLFYAERHTTESNFKVETSIALIDDKNPIVSIEATKPKAKKVGPVAGEFTLTLDKPAKSGGLVVNFGINELPAPPTPLRAVEGKDFTLQPIGTSFTTNGGGRGIIFPEGQTQVKIQVNPQGQPQPNALVMDVIANLKPSPTYQIKQPCAVVTICDNLPVPTVKIERVSDADKVILLPGAFRVKLGPNEVAPVNLTVNYRVFPGSPAVENGDYIALSRTVVIPAGQSEALIFVLPLGSQNVNATIPLALQLGLGDGYQIDSTPATVNIIDRAVIPLKPMVAIIGTGPAYRNPRKDGFFTIVCANTANKSLTVTYQLSGTAIMGRDYNNIVGVAPGTPFGTVVIPPGVTSVRLPVIPTLGFGSTATVRVTATIQPSNDYDIGANPAHVDILAQDLVLQGAR